MIKGACSVIILATVLLAWSAEPYGDSGSYGRDDSAERWQKLTVFAGSVADAAFGRSRITNPSALVCDALLRDGRLLFVPNDKKSRQCAVAPLEIAAIAITRLGYQRGSFRRPRVVPSLPGTELFGVIDLMLPHGTTRHSIALEFNSENERKSIVFFVDGDDGETLLRALAHVTGQPVRTSAADAASLRKSLAVDTHSPDPMLRLIPGVPLWETRRVPFPGGDAFVATSPDGSVLLAKQALWDASTGRQLAVLPGKVRNPWNVAFSPDGRALVVSEKASLAVIDVPSGTVRGRMTGPIFISRLAVSNDGKYIVLSYQQQQPRTGCSLSRISAVDASVVWRIQMKNPMSCDVLTLDAGVDRVLAFGRQWIGLFRADTGESLPGPDIGLADASNPRRASVYAAALAADGRRLIVAFTSDAKTRLEQIDLESGHTVSTAPMPPPSPFAPLPSFSADRRKALLAAEGGYYLWDVESSSGTALAGMNVALNSVLAHRVVTAVFDASGRYVATPATYPIGLPGHVVVWDVSSAKPVGQCLMDGVDTMRLPSGGRTVLTVNGQELLRCTTHSEADSQPRFMSRSRSR